MEIIEGRNDRFASLYKDTIEHFIDNPHVVIGCGSIGGYIIRILGQIGVKNLTLWDHDTVELVNIGPQGFSPSRIGHEKAIVRADEFLQLSPDSSCQVNNSKFSKLADHPSGAYWWMAVDSLTVREFIFKYAIEHSPHKIIDTRMGGLNYEIYNILLKTTDEYFETIQYARENPVEESCTTRSTPHTAMLAASIAVNMALSTMSPWAVRGNMMDYAQEAIW